MKGLYSSMLVIDYLGQPKNDHLQHKSFRLSLIVRLQRESILLRFSNHLDPIAPQHYSHNCKYHCLQLNIRNDLLLQLSLLFSFLIKIELGQAQIYFILSLFLIVPENRNHIHKGFLCLLKSMNAFLLMQSAPLQSAISNQN